MYEGGISSGTSKPSALFLAGFLRCTGEVHRALEHPCAACKITESQYGLGWKGSKSPLSPSPLSLAAPLPPD